MFPISMTFTVSTAEELANLVAVANNGRMTATEVSLRQAPPVTASEVVAAEEKAAPVKKSAAKSQPAASSPTTAEPSAAPEPKVAPSENTPPATTEIGYDDVKKVILEVAQKKGRDAAMAVLGEFGIDNLQKAKPEQYKPILDAATKALVG